MVWNISLVHQGQLSHLCPLPATLSPSAHLLQGCFSSVRGLEAAAGAEFGGCFGLCISHFQQKAEGRKGQSKSHPGLLIAPQGSSLHVVSSPPQHYPLTLTLYPPTTPPVALLCHSPMSKPTALIIASASVSPFSRWINALGHPEPSKRPSPLLLHSLKEKEQKIQAVHCDKPC